jgi:hypothetical protein
MRLVARFAGKLAGESIIAKFVAAEHFLSRVGAIGSVGRPAV